MMRYRFSLALAFVASLFAMAAESAVAADSAPESLLAKESVAYFRFDGLATHRTAYGKTILAEVIREEFRPLINEIAKSIFDAIGPQVLSERLLEGVPPAELIRLQKATRQLPQFVSHLEGNGVAVGVELIDVSRGRFQITIVFPGGPKSDPTAALGAFRLMGHLFETTVRDVKVGKRTVLSLADASPVIVNCWKEGPHAVLTIGTESPQHTIDLAEGKRPNLTSNAAFNRLQTFRRYETWMRGFADVDAVTKLVQKAIPPAAAMISQLGVDGLRDVSFHFGFEGQLQRSTVLVETRGKRRGLLRLLTPPNPFQLKSLPALPPDVSTVSAGTLAFPAVYEESLKAIRLLVLVSDPESAIEFDKSLKQFEKSLGVDLRKDLIDSLGTNYVIYNSPSEGPFVLGATAVIEVKDAAKLKRSLDVILRSLSALLGVDVATQKRSYRDGEFYVISFGDDVPFQPTFAIHKGWLVIGLFPQPVKGFIYRNQGKAAAWQPNALVHRAIRESLTSTSPVKGTHPPQLVGVGVSDPKHSLKQMLSLAPIFMTILRMAGDGIKRFDTSTIPNSQPVTDKLDNNVTVIVDDGTTLRLEGYSTIPALSQVAGLDFFLLMSMYQVFQFAF